MFVFFATATLLSSLLMAAFGPTLMKTITHATRQIVGGTDFGIISITRGACPCFNEGSIEMAINSIQSGESKLDETLSCKGDTDTDEDKITKSVQQLASYPDDGQVQGSDGVVQGKSSKASFLRRKTRKHFRILTGNGMYYGYSSSSAKGLYKCHIGSQSIYFKLTDSIDYVDCKIIIDNACSRLARENKK